MDLNERQLIQQGFVITNALPAAYQGKVLPDSTTLHAQGAAGTLLLQQVDQSQFSLRYQVFHIFRPLELLTQPGSGLLLAVLALKNTLHYSIQGLGSLELRPGQFALLHLPPTQVTVHFERAQEYQHLQVAWSAELLRPLLPHFPLLGPVCTPLPASPPFFVGTPGRAAGSHAVHLAQELLTTPMPPEVRSLYFDNKVREYLLLLLVASGQIAPTTPTFTRDEQERLVTIAERLRQETAKKFPIAQLARDVHMNEMKLKTAFKTLFGQGIFEYHLEARMQEAHRLLEETDLPTKAIAARVGYDLTTSFITKFREFFGYPPSRVSNR